MLWLWYSHDAVGMTPDGCHHGLRLCAALRREAGFDKLAAKHEAQAATGPAHAHPPPGRQRACSRQRGSVCLVGRGKGIGQGQRERVPGLDQHVRLRM